MKKSIFILMMALLAGVTTSCVSQRNIDKNYAPFKPDVVRLNVTMDDYVYLGDVTVEVEYKTYLGIFRKVLSINGEEYDPRNFRSTSLTLGKNIKLGLLHKALYKVTDTYANADYILPVSDQLEVKHMFLGRERKRSVTFKVFQLAKSSGVMAEKAEMESQRNAAQEESAALRQERDELQQQLNDAQKRIDDLEALQRATRGGSQRRR